MALNQGVPAPHSLRVQIGTFNYNLRGSAEYETPDLQPWLVPTLAEEADSGYATSLHGARVQDGSAVREAPDIYAVGFQELLPLHVGFSGSGEGVLPFLARGAGEVLFDTDNEIRKAIRPHQAVVNGDGMYPARGGGPEGYALIAKKHMVGLALFVYARERNGTVARIKEVRTSSVGTGFFNLLGNKGAVGARIVVAGGGGGHGAGSEPDQVLTFVCAHLAAHDHNVLRRNRDWANIVSRLVFPPDAVQPLPRLQKSVNSKRAQQGGPTGLKELETEYVEREGPTRPGKALDREEHGLYDSSNLFLLGDLNYRIAVDTPPVPWASKSLVGGRGPLKQKEVGFKVAMEEWPLLSAFDQLSIERAAKRTFHGLTESPLGNVRFGPTYKYKVDKKAKRAKKGDISAAAAARKKKGVIASRGELSKKRIPGWTDRILWRSYADGKKELPDQSAGAIEVELYRSIMTYIVRAGSEEIIAPEQDVPRV